MSYSVEDHPLGVIVRGPIPVSELVALLDVWRERKLAVLVYAGEGAFAAVKREDVVEFEMQLVLGPKAPACE